MNIIEVKELCYSYDNNRLALDKVSLTIKEGEITAILGGNGAGKSTLFLNMNGILNPSRGEVYFKGELVKYNLKGINEMRRRVGIVFQDPNDQLFSADVLSDISFGVINLGLSEGEVKKRVDGVVSHLGISEYINSPTHALSFGQKKRVAIAGVLAMRPDVIILDEPTAGLDPAGVSEILKLLVKIKEEYNVSIIIATHDIDIIPLYCDYIYVLDNGRVVMNGTCDEIFMESEKLRSLSLRLPRISHLMEILSKVDNLNVDKKASTISLARKSIKELFQEYESQQ